MYNLKFKDMVFEESPYPLVTIRKGWKWYAQLFIGDRVKLGGKYIAEILDIQLYKFKEIPEIYILLEHNPSYRDRDSLFSIMKELYKEFDQNMEVTVIAFKILDSECMDEEFTKD